MPDLPTKTLSQAHYNRVVAAFPGETLAEKAESYDAWLTNHLIAYVEQVEIQAILQAAQARVAEKTAELKASLPPRVPFPPGTTIPLGH